MLQINKLSKTYRSNVVLKELSFEVKEHECVGIVGKSGSGKSTLARLMLGLETPSTGEVLMENEPIVAWQKAHGGEMSVVFQDYTTSINPRFCVEEALQEPFWQAKTTLKEKELADLLERVELPQTLLRRYVHELSGGQAQRVALARAIARKPRFLVLDEALSSLDVSIQSQMVRLLAQLKEEFQMSYVFIAHDLESVCALCDRFLVLHNGSFVDEINLNNPFLHQEQRHPYTKQLLDAVMPSYGVKK